MPPCSARDDACVPAPGAHTDQAPRAGPAGPSFRAPEVWGPLPRSVSSSHVRPRRGSGAGELGKRAGAGWAAGMARTGGTGRASDPQQQHRRRIHGDPTARDSGHPSIDLLPEACPGSLRRRAPPTGAQGPGRAPIHSTEGAAGGPQSVRRETRAGPWARPRGAGNESQPLASPPTPRRATQTFLRSGHPPGTRPAQVGTRGPAAPLGRTGFLGKGGRGPPQESQSPCFCERIRPREAPGEAGRLPRRRPAWAGRRLRTGFRAEPLQGRGVMSDQRLHPGPRPLLPPPHRHRLVKRGTAAPASRSEGEYGA